MSKRLELSGVRFGRLVALSPTEEVGNSIKWLCQCDCGTLVSVSGSKLKREHTKSCGCLQREKATTQITENRPEVSPNFKHGESKSMLAQVWYQMIYRCEVPTHPKYHYWGGKGIKVCPEWRGDFLKFRDWALEAGWAPGLQLDRVDNAKDYSPHNCQWLTASEHSKKTRKDQNEIPHP